MPAPFARGVRVNCLGVTELMFCWPISSAHGKASWSPNIDLAKSVCTGCPVKRSCLEYALGTNQQDGIWGGHTPWERRSIKRKRQRAATAQRAATG